TTIHIHFRSVVQKCMSQLPPTGWFMECVFIQVCFWQLITFKRLKIFEKFFLHIKLDLLLNIIYILYPVKHVQYNYYQYEIDRTIILLILLLVIFLKYYIIILVMSYSRNQQKFLVLEINLVVYQNDKHVDFSC